MFFFFNNFSAESLPVEKERTCTLYANYQIFSDSVIRVWKE